MRITLVTIVFFQFVILVRSDLVLTKSGEVIPSETLLTVLQYSISPGLTRHVFHLSEQGILSSPNRKIYTHGSTTTTYDCSLTPSVHSYSLRVSMPMSELICRRARSYAFVYQRDPNRLVAVLGKKLSLYELDPINYPGVFLNRYDEGSFKPFAFPKPEPLSEQWPTSIPSPVSNVSPHSQISPDSVALPPGRTTAMQTSLLRVASTANGPCAKGELRFVELAIAYDTTLCDSFKNVHYKTRSFVSNAVQDADKIFRKNTCIRLRIVYDDRSCWEEAPVITKIKERSKLLTKPLNLTTCSSKDCDLASVVLGHFRTFWYNVNAEFYPRHDAVLFVSGYDDGTNVIGASFLKSICDPLMAFAWVEAPRHDVRSEASHSIMVAAIVHEISHLLGAKHAQTGIMKRNLHAKHMSQLSASSVTELTQFIDEDARSWCVSRNITTEGAGNKTIWSILELNDFYPSYTSSFLTFGMRKVDSANLEKEPNFVIFAVAEWSQETSRTLGDGRAFELRKYLLSPNGTLVLQEWNSVPSSLLPSGMSNRESTSMIMVFPPLPSGSFPPYVVMKHYDDLYHGIWRSITMARIQSEFNNDAVLYEMDSDMNAARYVILFENKHGGYDKSTSTGYSTVRNWSSRKAVSQTLTSGAISNSRSNDLLWMYFCEGTGRRILRYRVALNLNLFGKPENGWSAELSVPGWYGPSSGGILASIRDVTGDGKPDLIFAFYEWASSTYSSYYRVGRNLDRNGHVTGGWSEFRRVRDVDLWLEEDHEAKIRDMIVADVGTEEPALITRNAWHLQRADNSFSDMRFHTPKLVYAERDETFGCRRCFVDSNKIRECESSLKLCAANYDELRLDKGLISGVESRISLVPQGERAINNQNDFFCDGFDYLYINQWEERDPCDITDEDFVVANGVIEAYLQILNKTNKGEFLEESREINKEVASGANGPHRKPGIGYIIVLSTREQRISTLRKAFNNLQRDYGPAVSGTRVNRIGKRRFQVFPMFNWYMHEL